MGRAKEIIVKVIPGKIANPFIKKHHYSGKVVNNSCLHFGAFLDGKLHGVLSYGPSLDKSKMLSLVEGTGWNEFLELNRMAFDDYLPRNSESYCIAKTIKLIKKNAPQIKWIVSFADGCSCGDGTIYRASNFVLTAIKPNYNLVLLPTGEKIHKMTLESNPTTPRKELGGGHTTTLRAVNLILRNMLKRLAAKFYRASSFDMCISSTRNAGRSCPFPKSRFPGLMKWAQECTRGKRSRRRNAM